MPAVKQETLNNILDHGAQLDREVTALKTMLTQLQFVPENQNCCPVCGGHEMHDTACVLAALIYPEYAKSYTTQTGGDTAIDAMLWQAENGDLEPWKIRRQQGAT